MGRREGKEEEGRKGEERGNLAPHGHFQGRSDRGYIGI